MVDNLSIAQEYRRLLSIARRYVRPPILPEDIVQQIIMEAIENGNPIESIPYIAVKHRCYDTLRRYHREQKYCESVCKAGQSSTDTAQTGLLSEVCKRAESICRDVEVLLSRTCLTSLEQHVIYLKFYKGRTVHQCSAELHRTQRDVRLALCSAIEKIKATQRGLSE